MTTEFETPRLQETTDDTLSQWPTLTAAIGCLDCKRLFRHLRHDEVQNASVCPFCGNASVINVAEILNPKPDAPKRVDPGPILEALERIIHDIEEVIDSESIIT